MLVITPGRIKSASINEELVEALIPVSYSWVARGYLELHLQTHSLLKVLHALWHIRQSTAACRTPLALNRSHAVSLVSWCNALMGKGPIVLSYSGIPL